MNEVVIVGGGLAGASAASALRAEGFDGVVTLVGSESHPPYERPPLSKSYLRGESDRPEAYVTPEEWWARHGVEVRTGVRVRRIDRVGRSVELADGTSRRFDWLILAPGSRARTLRVPGGDLEGVRTLRTFEDADEIRARARDAEHVLVVGGGWIGSEVTASLRQLDVPVTLAVSAHRPLERALGERLAGLYDRLHRDHGAALLPRTRIVALEGDGRVRAARTVAGDRIPADLVVVAIGAAPLVDLAQDAGLTVSDGVVVDGLLRTDDRTVLAAGDIARVPYPDLRRSLRVEHWGAARAQGEHAARTVVGARQPYAELPYFYSDQYETGMEFWGDPLRPGEVVVRGDPESLAFDMFWQEDGRVRAALNMHVHHHHDHAAPDDHHDHAGGHLDPAVVARLLRSPGVDVGALGDPDVPLDAVVPGDR
ncbi:NAD(P)/FAD-dependent oxidoreductase [Georgenia yuyongxinii]